MRINSSLKGVIVAEEHTQADAALTTTSRHILVGAPNHFRGFFHNILIRTET
jgi:hypothetical protein